MGISAFPTQMAVTTETRDEINRAYNDILGREPDAPGFALWADRIQNSGLSDEGLRGELLNSPEYAAKHASTPSPRFSLPSSPSFHPIPRNTEMLNANRPVDRVNPAQYSGGSNDAQKLPTNNTTATRSGVAFDWKKYAPWLLIVLVVLLLLFSMKGKRRAAQ